MPKEERVFSHVGCWSLSGFVEISEAVFEAGKSLTEKAEQERRMLQNVYIFVGLTAGSSNVRERECVFSISSNGENERECAISVSEKCERESVC